MELGNQPVSIVVFFFVERVLIHVSECDRTLAGSEFLWDGNLSLIPCFFCFFNLVHMTIPINAPSLVS